MYRTEGNKKNITGDSRLLNDKVHRKSELRDEKYLNVSYKMCYIHLLVGSSELAELPWWLLSEMFELALRRCISFFFKSLINSGKFH